MFRPILAIIRCYRLENCCTSCTCLFLVTHSVAWSIPVSCTLCVHRHVSGAACVVCCVQLLFPLVKMHQKCTALEAADVRHTTNHSEGKRLGRLLPQTERYSVWRVSSSGIWRCVVRWATHYTASYPRRRYSSKPPLWKPQILHYSVSLMTATIALGSMEQGFKVWSDLKKYLMFHDSCNKKHTCMTVTKYYFVIVQSL
jgi:hypothetical protein